MQKTKEALIEHKISMPDDAREVVFASPLKIERFSSDERANPSKTPNKGIKSFSVEEGSKKQDLTSEIDDLKKQALLSPDAEKGENLVKP